MQYPKWKNNANDYTVSILQTVSSVDCARWYEKYVFLNQNHSEWKYNPSNNKIVIGKRVWLWTNLN